MKEQRKKEIKGLMERFHTLRHGMSPQIMFSKNMSRITPAQMTLLMSLKEHKNCTIKCLASNLCITSSAATQLVEELVKNGFIVRKSDPRDRRAVMLSLSKKTEKFSQKIENHILNNTLKLFNALNDKEFKQYIKLNKKIVANFINNKS